MTNKKQLGFLIGTALSATLGFAASSAGFPSKATDTTTSDTTTTAVTTVVSSPTVSIKIKPAAILVCPSRYATSTTVSGAITPKQATAVTVTLQSRSVKGGSWTTVDSLQTTGEFKFTEVGKCSKHGLWFRATVSSSAIQVVVSQNSLMKVMGNPDIDPMPGNFNATGLRKGSMASIGIDTGGGDVGFSVRYEVQKKGVKNWRLIQTCTRGKIFARDKESDAVLAYRCQFKVPPIAGVYHVRGHFLATATTSEVSTHAYTMTVVR